LYFAFKARAIQDIVHISKKVERGVPTRLFQVFHLSASGRRAPPMEALSLRLSVHNKFKCSKEDLPSVSPYYFMAQTAAVAERSPLSSNFPGREEVRVVFAGVK
jgi:hypothetical protein